MTDIREDLVTFLKTATGLKGSADTPAGTWPQLHGPVILPFADASQLEQTSIYIGDENGEFLEDYIQSETVGYRQNRTFEIVMTVGPNPFTLTMQLARAQIAAVYALFKNDPVFTSSTARIGLLNGIEGPNPFPTDNGVCAVTSLTIEVSDFL
jgi:hypothetical protein